jgi:hypothetical protein
MDFPAQPLDLRRLPLVARVCGQVSAHPGCRRLISTTHVLWIWSVCFLFVDSRFRSPLLSAPTSRSDRLPGFFALRVRLRFSATCHLRGLSPPIHAHAGHTRSRLRGSLAAEQMTGIGAGLASIQI